MKISMEFSVNGVYVNDKIIYDMNMMTFESKVKVMLMIFYYMHSVAQNS